MNTKNSAVALIAGLSYEVLLKLCRTLVPSLFDVPLVATTSSMLSLLVGLAMILFLVLIYKEHRSNQGVVRVSVSLVACLLVRFALRLLLVRGRIEFHVTRFVDVAIGLVTALLLFLLVLWFRRSVPVDRKSLRHAASLLATLLAIGLVTHLYSLIDYAHFMTSGIPTDDPPLCYHLMLLLFILTHASAIYFLLRYSQFKATPQT
jgi:hypothetical protein